METPDDDATREDGQEMENPEVTKKNKKTWMESRRNKIKVSLHHACALIVGLNVIIIGVYAVPGDSL